MNSKCKVFLSVTAYMLLGCLLPLHAANTGKDPMYVDAQFAPGDSIGPRMMRYLREDVRKSASYHLIKDSSPAWGVYITTIVDKKGVTTAYSVALVKIIGPTTPDLYVDSFVGLCGDGSVRDCASSLLSYVDQDLKKIKSQ